MAALLLAIDIGMGQPLEQGLRTCLIATGLARRMGLDEEDVRRVFYLSLLRHVGCTAESETAASFLGDEIAFRSDAITLDFTKPSAMLPYVIRHVGEGKSVFGRARHVGKVLTGSKTFLGTMDSVCETAQLLATRLGLDEVVQRSLWQIFEHWDGKGLPGRVGGEEILLPARFVTIAELFEGLCRARGPADAVTVIAERRGTAFAPEIADCLCRDASAFEPFFERPTVWDDVLAVEPEPRHDLTDEQFDDVLAAMADFTDLKSSYTLGHSRGVADLAGAAAGVAGLPAADVTTLRRAGLVHDVGRVGISAGAWGKRGGLSRDDWEKVRLHPYYTERVLTRPPALARLGRLASTHDERLDGGGYHRAVSGSMLSRPARILAAADGYRARTESRPHRAALPADEAAASLRDDVRDGRLDADAVDAVLEAAGQGGGRKQRARFGGLTDRELEVLALVARGQSIREMAGTLTISPKTADAHIQHIYTKLGVSTRAGATPHRRRERPRRPGPRSGDLPMTGTPVRLMLRAVPRPKGTRMAHREELARQMLELTDEQDWFAREALLTEDCEVLTPAGLLRGRAATTAYSRPLVGAFSEARHLLDFVATAGDVVVVEGHWVGRHTGPLATPDGDVPPTGKSLRLPFVATVRVCDDLVSSVHIYSTS